MEEEGEEVGLKIINDGCMMDDVEGWQGCIKPGTLGPSFPSNLYFGIQFIAGPEAQLIF